MTNENNASPVPVSNWTLATGTQPFHRPVCIGVVTAAGPDERVMTHAAPARERDQQVTRV